MNTMNAMHVHLPGYVVTLKDGRLRCWMCGRTWERVTWEREAPLVRVERHAA